MTTGNACVDGSHWTDVLTAGQHVVFSKAIDQGEYLQIADGETGMVFEVVRIEPAYAVVQLDATHWELGSRNMLAFDAYCEDVLQSLRIMIDRTETNSNLVSFSDRLAVPNTA